MLHLGYELCFTGLVQGVGFRPLVFKLAKEQGLKGEVYNDARGVIIKLLCDELKAREFAELIRANLPPLGFIQSLELKPCECEAYSAFSISSSKLSLRSSPILSDFALCKQCQKEFYDTQNPRFHYPFITCTHCGVRFSIIKSLPYDRANTTMSKYKMCEFCKSEYEDPLNRRFHAQPISCPKCKIKVFLKDNTQKLISEDLQAFKDLALALKQGKIIALKGLGGYHLICDALNEKAISALRMRKNRPKKPFALMCKDINEAQKLAHISQKEAELLSSNIKPIVLLKAKESEALKPVLAQLSPQSKKLGIMLAYTPLHLLLFEYFHNPIIATSANLSGEGIIYEEAKLYEKLGFVFDYALEYDREIYNSSDDSIAQVIGEKVMFLRTSRGVNPYYISFDKGLKQNILALGSELKNQMAIFYDNKLLISPYIGDLKSLDTSERFFKSLEFFKRNYELTFTQVLSDKHPNFSYVKAFKDYENLKVQHHYAHACAVLFEYKIFTQKRLAFVFDGTGYGDDGKIWGGELLRASLKDYERIGHFEEFKLINADIKHVKNLALALILHFNLVDKAKEFLVSFEPKTLSNLSKIYAQSKLETSSFGRIIDAFAGVIFKLERLSYEAEAGLLMESFYDESLNFSYEFECENNIISVKKAFEAVLQEKDKVKACTGFLNATAKLIIKLSKDEEPLLCGGVFQNKTLLQILDKQGFNYKVGLKFPPNDSSIALGQMAHYLALQGLL